MNGQFTAFTTVFIATSFTTAALLPHHCHSHQGRSNLHHRHVPTVIAKQRSLYQPGPDTTATSPSSAADTTVVSNQWSLPK